VGVPQPLGPLAGLVGQVGHRLGVAARAVARQQAGAIHGDQAAASVVPGTLADPVDGVHR
jgi:hypothetical protein